jgi:hypothetical protein
MYYYVIDEYRVSNQLLTEDIYVRSLLAIEVSHTQWLMRTQALQSAVQRIEGYVRTLEEKVDKGRK